MKYFIKWSILAKSIVDSDEKTALKAMDRIKKKIEILSPENYADFYAFLMVTDEDGNLVETEGINNEPES